VKDNICDLKCPQVAGLAPPQARCCRHCRVSRCYFVTPENSTFWTDEAGFLGDNGCKLDRNSMPPECKAYDCKNDIFYFCAVKYAPLVWDGDKWKLLQAIEAQFVGELDNINDLTKTINALLTKYNSVHRDCIVCPSRDSKSCQVKNCPKKPTN